MFSGLNFPDQFFSSLLAGHIRIDSTNQKIKNKRNKKYCRDGALAVSFCSLVVFTKSH